MGFHMKTTLEIDETVMRELKARAAREGRTMSELVDGALRALLQEKPRKVELPPLPVFDLGGLSRYVDDRELLEGFLEDGNAERLTGASRKKGDR
jgi:hypothetical protein